MLIPDDDLAAIDAVAEPNRTAFVLAAVREALTRVHRQRLELEIARCLLETADEDRERAEEFSGTVADRL